MSVYNKLFKKTTEKHFITASIVNVKQPTEEVILAGSSVSAVDKSGTSVSTTILAQATIAVIDHPNRDDGTKACLTIRCKAGTATASPYVITFSLATTLGNLFVVSTDLFVV